MAYVPLSSSLLAVRPVCNICNAPKPKAVLTQEEIRTGAGGGFNERQERAAATTIEVADDGYDDFGRRAKEKKASDKKAKEVPPITYSPSAKVSLE